MRYKAQDTSTIPPGARERPGPYLDTADDTIFPDRTEDAGIETVHPIISQKQILILAERDRLHIRRPDRPIEIGALIERRTLGMLLVGYDHLGIPNGDGLTRKTDDAFDQILSFLPRGTEYDRFLTAQFQEGSDIEPVAIKKGNGSPLVSEFVYDEIFPVREIRLHAGPLNEERLEEKRPDWYDDNGRKQKNLDHLDEEPPRRQFLGIVGSLGFVSHIRSNNRICPECRFGNEKKQYDSNTLRITYQDVKNPRKEPKRKNMRFPKPQRIFIVVVAVAVSLGAFYVWKILRTAETVSIGGRTGTPSLSDILPGGKREPLRGEEMGRVNILLLGRAGERYPGRNLTDTVMLASLDLSGRRSAFLSIPRDLFVPIPDSNLSTKLNSLYQHGLSSGNGADTVVRAVEQITGQDIPYYVILDFDGFERIIDEIGGVTVLSERDILDTRYPGKNYSYETFDLKAGWHTLDGATALKYARERHSDPEGDFGRAKRQQQIIKAFQEKVFSVETLLNALAVNRMLDTLGESVRTNLSVGEMLSLAETVRTIDVRNASTVVVDAWKSESLLRVSHLDIGGVRAFILLPRTGNWTEIRDLSEHVFEQDTIEKRRASIAKEAPTISIISSAAEISTARRLNRTLSDTIPGADIRTIAVAGLPVRSRSAVVEHSPSSKIMTLDELLKLFSLERLSALPDLVAANGEVSAADFVIILGTDMNATLLSEDATTAENRKDVPETDAFPDFFPAQAR